MAAPPTAAAGPLAAHAPNCFEKTVDEGASLVSRMRAQAHVPCSGSGGSRHRGRGLCASAACGMPSALEAVARGWLLVVGAAGVPEARGRAESVGERGGRSWRRDLVLEGGEGSDRDRRLE